MREAAALIETARVGGEEGSKAREPAGELLGKLRVKAAGELLAEVRRPKTPKLEILNPWTGEWPQTRDSKTLAPQGMALEEGHEAVGLVSHLHSRFGGLDHVLDRITSIAAHPVSPRPQTPNPRPHRR